MKISEHELLNLIAKSLEIESKQISLDSSIDEIGINSISFIKIIVDIENIFNIEIPDDQLNKEYFNTIKDLYEFLAIYPTFPQKI